MYKDNSHSIFTVDVLRQLKVEKLFSLVLANCSNLNDMLF